MWLLYYIYCIANLGTNGAEESVIVSEVPSFHIYIYTHRMSYNALCLVLEVRGELGGYDTGG